MSDPISAPEFPGEVWRGQIGSRTFVIDGAASVDLAVRVWTREGRWALASGVKNQRDAWAAYATELRAETKPRAQTTACESVSTAPDGGPVKCQATGPHDEHFCDYSGPMHHVGALVHRWR